MFENNGRKVLPKYLAKEVILQILDRAKNENRRDYLILLILWMTGMRVSELKNLKKRDILIGDGIINIWQGKGKKDRVIPLNNELGNIIGFYLDNLKPNQELFDIKVRQMRNVVYKYIPDGFKGSPHTFRHSFAVNCLKCGMNIRSLQKIMGHKHLSTTQVYLDIVGDDIKDDFKKVSF